MPFDFCNIVHSTNRKPEEFSIQRPIKFIYILPKSHLAIDLPMEVLPTPGGPTKHKIFPCNEPLREATAMNSEILCFTSSSP